MTVPNLGDIAANAHFGYEERLARKTDGGSVANDSNSEISLTAAMTFPFTGVGVLVGAMRGYFNGWANPQLVSLDSFFSGLSLNTSGIWTSAYQYPGGATTYPVVTVPFQYWHISESAGTSFTPTLKITTGTGGQAFAWTSVAAVVRFFRT